MDGIRGKAAIVGVALSAFSENSRKTELRMSCEIIKAALEDAGLVVSDVDGLVKQSEDATDEHAVTSSMGMGNLAYFGEVKWGAAPCAMVLRSAMAVAAGVAKCVVVYRAVNGSSKLRMIPSMKTSGQMSTSDLLQWTFHSPFGLMTEAGRVAMLVRRYMHAYGARSEQFGWVTVVCRENGARNPRGVHYEKPVTIDEYMASRITVDPLRELDCYQESDCAAAFVITTPEMANDLKHRPAIILGAAQSIVGETEMLNSYYRPDIDRLPEMGSMAGRLYEMAGVKPTDIQVAQLDDSYAPLVAVQLEELGFCGRGEGAAYCEGGNRIRLGGKLPLNTAGGSLGEGHIHGMNHVVEAVRQIRGTSTGQVEGAELALVAAGAGGPAGGLILGR
jgi:17-hydroxy-3-oxo-4-pregnene-20-carboxyl-CoA lyase